MENSGRIMPQDIKFATDDVTVYLAAAGAGKTSAIMREMTRLLEVYRPDEIAFVTFTRKGVANGIERALRANPQLSPDDLAHFKTLHALCFRELGLKRTSVMEDEHIKQFNEKYGFDLRHGETLGYQSNDDRLLTRYDAIRGGCKKEEVLYGGEYDEVRYSWMVAEYEKFKREHGLVDFHDCLLRFRDADKPVNVKVAFIDEAQDLTLLQWQVCQTAFSLCEKIVIAGDDFQSLFTYSGASPQTLVKLANKCATVKLETSYRLSKAVYRFAKGITNIIEIEEKIDKDFEPVKDLEGFVEDISDRHILVRRIRKDLEDNGVMPSRWYLLFRNNCFIGEAAKLLEQYSVPYHTAAGFCIPKDALMKIKRYYNYRKTGFGSGDVFARFCAEHHIRDINEDFTESALIPTEKRYVYYDYVKKYGVAELEEIARKEPYILLSTTHRVKGGEADYVAVFLDCTHKVSANQMLNVNDELRVLYVACTRAKTGLYLVQREGAYGLDKVVEVAKEQAA